MTVVGAVLVLLGVVVPSTTWLQVWRGAEATATPVLVLGAQLFRAGLVVCGVYAVIGGRLGWWRTGRDLTIETRPAAPPVSGREWAMIASLVLAAIALRWHRLGDGLWIDEILTLVESVRPPIGQIISSYPSQNHHILYSVLARMAFDVWGESAWALRLPAVIAGVATIVATWRFGRLVLGPREGLLAAAVLTFSYQHIWFSQNARGYSLLLFWAVASSHLLIRGLRENRGDVWLAYGLTVALGMYTHMTMIFVVAGQLCVYAVRAFRPDGPSWAAAWRPLLAGFVPAGLVTILWYAPLLPQVPAASAADRSDVALWRSPLWLLQELARGAQLGPVMAIAAAGGLVILVAAAVAFARRRDWSLPILFGVPSGLGALTMIAAGHHLWPRFFLFVAAFAILVVIEGATEAVRWVGGWMGWSPRRRTQLATAGLVLGIAVLARTIPYVYGPKQDYAAARAFIESNRRPGAAVVTVGRSASAFRVYVAPEWGSVESLADLDSVRAAHRETWLVYTMPVEIENNYPEILRAAREDFELAGTFRGTLQGGEIVVYRAPQRGAPVPAGGSAPGTGS